MSDSYIMMRMSMLTTALLRVRQLLIFAALLAAAPGVRAQATSDSPARETITKVGTTSAQFLKLGVGARALSLGGSFVARSNDLAAMYWNPAGLASLQGSSVQLAYTRYVADINYQFAAFGTNLGDMGTIAASIIYLDSGDMEVRTVRDPEGTGEKFKVQDFALQLSYGRHLTDRFAIGGSMKFVQERIWHSSASTIAFDVGTFFTTPYDRLHLAASFSNFGPKMQMSGRDILFSQDPAPDQQGNVEIVNSEYLMDEHPLPLLFRIGVAWDAVRTGNHQVIFSTDAAHPNDNYEYVNVGMEYSFRELVSFRAGYKNLFEEQSEQGLTFGGGINLRLDRALRARFDYAYADFGRLEGTHWFTVDLGF